MREKERNRERDAAIQAKIDEQTKGDNVRTLLLPLLLLSLFRIFISLWKLTTCSEFCNANKCIIAPSLFHLII